MSSLIDTRGAEGAQRTPPQRHVSPSILVYEEKSPGENVGQVHAAVDAEADFVPGKPCAIYVQGVQPLFSPHLIIVDVDAAVNLTIFLKLTHPST